MPKQHCDHCFDFYFVTRCSFTRTQYCSTGIDCAQCLNSKLHNVWTGQHGLNKWPSKSPDHTLILKPVVHTECLKTVQGLKEHIN